MLVFDNSQISEESIDQNSQKSDMQDLNQIRQMLPEAINKMDQYFIPQQVDQRQEDSKSINHQQQEMMFKIRQQMHLILELEEKLYYYRTECFRLIEQNQEIKQNMHQIQTSNQRRQQYTHQLQKKLEEEYLKVSHLQQEMRKREQKIEQLNQTIAKKIQKKDKQLSFRHSYNHQMLSKQLLHQERLILDLTSRNEKILKINALLQKQLRLAQDKLVNLQVETQQKMCSVLIDNVSRLKQNQSHFSKSIQNHSSSVSRPIIEQNKTIKMQDITSQNRQQFVKEFKTIEKDRILKTIDYKHDYKLQPLQSPKPHRKSNRCFIMNNKKDPREQKYKQKNRYQL